MIRKLILWLLALAMLGYLGFIFFSKPHVDSAMQCQGVDIRIHALGEDLVLDKEEVLQELHEVIGAPQEFWRVDSLPTFFIEERMESRHALLGRVELFFTQDNRLQVDVTQRTPLFLLLCDSGRYYVTDEGRCIPASPNERHAIPLPIVHGSTNPAETPALLVDLIAHVTQDPLWSHLFSEYYLDERGNLIVCGPLSQCSFHFGRDYSLYPQQLDNLRLFIEQAIPKFGWGHFSRLILTTNDRIIAKVIHPD